MMNDGPMYIYILYDNVRQLMIIYYGYCDKTHPRPDDVENHRDGPGVIPRPVGGSG